MAASEPNLTCAVTGANGYVGGVIARALRGAGGRVIALQRRDGPDARRYALGEPLSPGLLAGVDVLVHCAYDWQPLRWPEIERVNVGATFALFDAARTAGVGRIVFISSASAFEGCRSNYGKAKMAVERRAGEWNAVVVRPGVVFGPGAKGMMGSLMKLAGLPAAPMVGGGGQLMQMVHEDDLGAAMVRLARRPWEPVAGPVTAAAERLWTLRELMRLAAEARGRRPVFVPLPWRAIWLLLKAAESAGLRPRTRSDSLIALMHPNPSPDFTVTRRLGLTFREPDRDSVSPRVADDRSAT